MQNAILCGEAQDANANIAPDLAPFDSRENCMLHTLKLTHIGPVANLDAHFAPRLNLITGDNGLGKSFLLDVAWWAMTKRWPAELNRKLTSGFMARPVQRSNQIKSGSQQIDASIGYAVSVEGHPVMISPDGSVNEEASRSAFPYIQSKWNPGHQTWPFSGFRPLTNGIVLYAMADGGFSVWDCARNDWTPTSDGDRQERVKGYVFSPREVWDGLTDPERGLLCNGLVSDWASWQKENGEAFAQLRAVLGKLSVGGEVMEPGPFTRISLDDPRDIPTLKMPYGQDTPVLFASSGMKRIIAFAYMLVWAWQEHGKASALLGKSPSTELTFLIDEVEAHLHPCWQRQVIGALLEVANELLPQANVQLIVTTHSPLVMASCEPQFNAAQDAWFDLDLEDGQVVFTQREFVKQGVVGNWLGSKAFDMPSDRAIEYETLIAQAALLLDQDAPDKKAIKEMNQKLVAALAPGDEFLFNWRYIARQKGWLK